MKRAIVFGVVVFLCVCVGTAAFGQFGIRKGLKLGYGWSTLSGDDLDDVESRQTITGGVGVEFRLLGFLACEVDVLYSSRGASYQDSETRLTYLSFPVVLKRKFFPVGVHPYLLVGPDFSLLLSAKTDDTDIKDQIKSQDWGVVMGGGLEFSVLGKSGYVEGRYSYGLNNIYEEGTDISAKNRTYQVFVGFLF